MLARDGALLAAAQLAQVLMTAGSVFILGRLGEAELAAGVLVHSIVAVALLSAYGVLQALPSLASSFIAAGDEARAGNALIGGLKIASVLAVPVSIVALMIPEMVGLMREADLLISLTSDYAIALVPGFLPGLVAVALYGYGAARGHGRRLLVISALAAALNLCLGLLLVETSLERLGIAGVGYALSITHWLTAIAFFFAVGPINLRLRRREPSKDRMVVEMLRIGLPVGLVILSEISLLAAVTMMMGKIGVGSLAAHGVVMQWFNILFVIPLGLSQAATIHVGRAVGRRDVVGIGRAGWSVALVAAVALSIQAALMVAVPEHFVAIFLDTGASPETWSEAVTFMQISAAASLFNGLVVVFAGTLRGLRDTRWPMIRAIFLYWGVGISTSVVLAFHLNLAGAGLWLGVTLGFAMAVLALVIRFSQYRTLTANLLAGP